MLEDFKNLVNSLNTHSQLLEIKTILKRRDKLTNKIRSRARFLLKPPPGYTDYADKLCQRPTIMLPLDNSLPPLATFIKQEPADFQIVAGEGGSSGEGKGGGGGGKAKEGFIELNERLHMIQFPFGGGKAGHFAAKVPIDEDTGCQNPMYSLTVNPKPPPHIINVANKVKKGQNNKVFQILKAKRQAAAEGGGGGEGGGGKGKFFF